MQLPAHRQQDWRTLLAVYWVVQLVEALGVSQIYAFMPNRLIEVGVAPGDVGRLVGLMSSLFFVSGLPLVPLWGVWADKYSRKAVVIRSALVEALVFGGVALSAAPWQLAASMLLVGFQLGNSGVMMAAIRDATPRSRLGMAMGIFAASAPLGFGAGPIIGAAMINHGLSSGSVFALSAILSLAMAGLLAVASSEVRPEHIPTGSTIRLAFGAFGRVFSDSQVRWLFTIMGGVWLARQMATPYIPLLVHSVEGTDLRQASSVGFVLGISALGALLAPLVGWFGDRLGFRAVLIAALAATGFAIAGIALAPAVGWIAASATLVVGLQASVGSMVYGLIAMEVPAERRSATLNLAYFPLYLGGIAGPALGSAIEPTGLPHVFFAGAVVAWLGAILAAVVLRTPEPASEPRAEVS